jgi:hypothetical protein
MLDDFISGTVYASIPFPEQRSDRHREIIMKKMIRTPVTCPLSFFLRLLEFANTPAPASTLSLSASAAPAKSGSAKILHVKKAKVTKKAMHPRPD